MFIRRVCTLSCVILAGFWISSASAQNIWWMHDTPGAYFNDLDRKMYDQSVAEMLESGATGTQKSWFNESSRNGGEITVFDSKRILEGNPCRYLKIYNYAHNGLKATTRIEACKRADGHWATVGVVPY